MGIVLFLRNSKSFQIVAVCNEIIFLLIKES